ncbi:MAG: hypothetical protein ACRDJU_09005 [Actinomycetota bacterium]
MTSKMTSKEVDQPGATTVTGVPIGDLAPALAELEASPAYPAAYLSRVREAVHRLDPLPPFPLDVPQALALVTQQSRVDVDVPLRTRRLGAKAAKIAIKRVTAFYLAYLADQVGDLGQALVHLGTALAVRVEGVEEELGDLRRSTDTSLADLARRIAALENGERDRPKNDPGA